MRDAVRSVISIDSKEATTSVLSEVRWSKVLELIKSLATPRQRLMKSDYTLLEAFIATSFDLLRRVAIRIFALMIESA